MLGTALLVVASVTTQPQPLAGQPGGETTVAGQTEVSRLVDLAAQRLHVRVEYDPSQLKGAVTVRGAGEGGIPDAELWESVNSALSGRGFTTILSVKPGATGEPSFTVVRLSDAAGLVLPAGPFVENALSFPNPAPGFAAVFFRVSNRTTKVAAELVRPLLSKTGSAVTPVGESDLLLVADLTPRLLIVRDFLQRIDLPQAQTEVFEVPLSHVSPQEVLAFVKDYGSRRDASNPRPPGDVLQQPGSNSVLVLGPV